MTASITIIRAKEFIVIAADSVASDEHDRETGKQCKIIPIGTFFYLPNKFVGKPNGGYDLDHIVADMGIPESLGVWTTNLKQTVPPILTHALSIQKQENPTKFADSFKTRVALGITLVGLENGAPTLVSLNFLIKELDAPNVELEIKDHRCPGDDCSDGIAMVLVGDEEFKKRFEQQNPNYWLGGMDRVVKNAEYFVQKAIDEKIPGVGPPISVLTIGSGGVNWRKRGLCHEG